MTRKKFFAFALMALLLIPAAALAHCSGTRLSIAGDIMGYDSRSGEPIVRLAPGGSFEATILVEGTTIWATILADVWGDADPIIEPGGAPLASQFIGGHSGGGTDHKPPYFTRRFTANSNVTQSGTYHVGLQAKNEDASDHETAAAWFYVQIVSDNDQPAEVINGDGQTLKVALGGKAAATFEGNQYTRSWEFDEKDLPYWASASIQSQGSAAQGQLIVTAKDDASALGKTAQVKIYARNGVGVRSQNYATVTLEAVNPGTEIPEIDTDCQNMMAYAIQGGAASVTLFGQHINYWEWGYYAGRSGTTSFDHDVKHVDLDYSANPNRCKVILTVSDDARITESAQGAQKVLTLFAYGKYGDVTSTDLSLWIVDKENFEDPKIVEEPSGQPLEIIQGGTVVASYRGEHVNRWSIERLPKGLESVEMRYDSDPNTCDMIIRATRWADLNSTPDVTVEAYNGAGENVTTTLQLKIVPNDNQKTPVIDGDQTLNVIPGGTASAVFTGKNIREWRYKWLPSDLKEIELEYEDNPNHCKVIVTASSSAKSGDTFQVPIYAYNGVGTEVSKVLNVKIISDPNQETPVIEGNQSVNVVPGGTVTATFTGQYTKTWRYKKLPSVLTGIDLQYASPHRCDVSIRASSSANAGDTFQVPIYAYNGVGKESAAAFLNVTIVNDADHENPVINGDQTLEVKAGKTGTVAFTGKNIKTWDAGALPDGLESINLKTSASDANRCYVIVTAHESATVGSRFMMPIYAYNGAGKRTSAMLTVEIVETAPTPDYPPTIKEDTAEYGVDLNHIVAMVGTNGVGKARYEGSENVCDWAHGPLPSWLYGFELSHDLIAYSNVCEVTLMASENPLNTASTSLAADSKVFSADIDIYAFNRDGASASSKLKVVWLDSDLVPTVSPDVVEVKVPAGGSTTADFSADNIITSWKVLSNPYENEGVSVVISEDNPAKGTAKATVTAKSDTALGRYPVVIGAVGFHVNTSTPLPAKSTMTVNVTSGSVSSNKSGGGCDAGFGALALLALAGFAALKIKR